MKAKPNTGLSYIYCDYGDLDLLTVCSFLLSARQVEFDLEADTRRKRLENPKRLPETVPDAFRTTIERIEKQSANDRLRGMQILTWVYLAERQLSIGQLLHALATETEDADLDRDNFLSRETFLGNCLGLVIMDNQSSTVSLLHRSLQEYLGTRGDLFESGNAMIAETCLTYLRFQSVIKHSKDMVNKAEDPRDGPNDLAPVEYAASEWGHQLRRRSQGRLSNSSGWCNMISHGAFTQSMSGIASNSCMFA